MGQAQLISEEIVEVLKESKVILMRIFKPCLLFTTQSGLLMNPFENIVGKGENAGDQYFLHFPQCFLPFTKEISIFMPNLF